MLITRMKDREALLPLLEGSCFIINCHGCAEVSFPFAEAEAFQTELKEQGKVTGVLTTMYLCEPGNMKLNLDARREELEKADAVLVFSCGVGVQTVASFLEGKKVLAACDTWRLPGFQGVTPQEADCGQCGECFLNLTGGICPITACSKSLVNGQCGGAKNGKCEVDPSMDCGWERIYRRLEELGRLDALRSPVQFHDFSTDKAVRGQD